MAHACYLCLVFAMRLRLFITVVWAPAGEGLTSWLLFVVFNCIFETFQCGTLSQVWYLIVLIPDLCCLSYSDIFYWPNMCPGCCCCKNTKIV